MKFRLLVLSATILCLTSFQQAPFDIAGLSWLSGCWEGTYANGRTVTEQWMKPLGGTMMGMSRTVKNGKTIAFETIRLVQDEDRSVHYVANPSGQQEASFRLIELTGTRAVFENQAHDYPQRIIYELVTPDSLSAGIEGLVDGKLKGSGFPYKRVSCE